MALISCQKLLALLINALNIKSYDEECVTFGLRKL